MWPNGLLNIVSRGSRSDANIYLTFDDGPDPFFTPRVLDLLAAHNVRASFFVLGAACDRFPRLLSRIVDEGHDVGCHSYSHRHPWPLSASQARDEVKRGFNAIRSTCGREPRVFRPPFGRPRFAQLECANQLGMTTILWSRSAIDWGAWGSVEAVAGRLAKVKRGDILLLHDAPRHQNRTAATLEALPAFIDSCREKGLRFARVSQLLNSEKVLPATNSKRA